MTPEEIVSSIIQNINSLEMYRSQGFYGVYGRIGKLWIDVTLTYSYDDPNKISFDWIDICKYVKGKDDWCKYSPYDVLVHIQDDLLTKEQQRKLIHTIKKENQKRVAEKQEQQKQDILNKIRELEI